MAKKQNYIWKNDRNFALDDYEKQQLYYVVEANDIINKARHDNCTRTETNGLCHFKNNA